MKIGPKIHPITKCRADTVVNQVWYMDVAALDSLVAEVKRFDLHEVAEFNAKMREQSDNLEQQEPYARNKSTAIIQINGATTKYPTSFSSLFGGTATTQVIDSFQKAMADDSIQSILLKVESPGGTVAGSAELVDIIRNADKVKPVHAHIEDMGTSAGYLYGSAARFLTANRTAETGSIGTLAVIYDRSQQFKNQGIEVHPIGTGEFKGAGWPGAPIPPKHLEYFKERVKRSNEQFIMSVMQGREMSEKKIREIASEARVYAAHDAKDLGLIDDVMCFDDAVEKLQSAPAAVRSSVARAKPLTATTAGPNPVRSKAMPFTAEQLKKARELPGAASLTEENAESTVLQVAMDLSEQLKTTRASLAKAEAALPRAADPAVVEERLSTAIDRVDLLAEKGVILPPQVAKLKAALGTKEAPNTVLLTPVNGEPPYRAFLQAFDMNKPNGLLKEASEGQPAPRTEPGAPEKPEDKPVSKARQNELREKAGLPALP